MFNFFFFLHQKYKRPLQDLIKTKDEILTEQQIACVFGFLEEVKTISKQLLTTMTQIVQPTTTGAGISNIFIEKVIPTNVCIETEFCLI